MALAGQSFNMTRATVKKELLTLPELLSSPPVFSGVPFARSIVFCVGFVDQCLSFLVLQLWYLQTFL